MQNATRNLCLSALSALWFAAGAVTPANADKPPNIGEIRDVNALDVSDQRRGGGGGGGARSVSRPSGGGGGRAVSRGGGFGGGRSVSRPSTGGRSVMGGRTGGRSVTGTRTGGRSVTGTRTTGRTATGTRTGGRTATGTRTTGRTATGTRTGGRTATGTRTGGRTATGTRGPGGRTATGTRGPGGRTATGTRGPGGRTATGTRGPGRIGTGPRGPGRVGTGPGRGPGRIGTGPRGPGRVGMGPGRGPDRIGHRYGSRHVYAVRGPRRIWMGDAWRTFVPLAALTGIYVGATYFEPDGYVAAAQPACSGISEDGCTLRWQEVPLEGGGSDMQCVQYCGPRIGSARAPVVAAPVSPPIVAAPPATVGSVPVSPAPTAADDMAQAPQVPGCAMTVFADANFGGISSPVQEDEPKLSEVGWQNEIGSLQIQSGTWEFFSDEDYTGDAMRMKPGQYGNLGPQWNKRIGSFMCIAP